MANNEESGSPGWRTSLFMQTTEDVAKAVVAAAATAIHSPRPSVVFSAKDDSNSPIQKLQHQVSRALKGFSRSPEVKRVNYNPEVLTSQKRQWANLQLQSLDHRSLKEPSKLFESMVVVGLHPNCDIQALEKQYFARKTGSGKFRSPLSGHYQSRIEPDIEPQVLFVYPPEKQLPLKYKDLLSFCFPGGLEVHSVERTPSMSELNEILLGQEHLKQSDMSFVFRLQVADNSTLYGCCVSVEEIIQKPSGLISMVLDDQSSHSNLRRHILTTRRCYCILTRLPFFELHFGVLNSIFIQERLERLTKGIGDFNLGLSEANGKGEPSEEKDHGQSLEFVANDMLMGRRVHASESDTGEFPPEGVTDEGCNLENQVLVGDLHVSKKGFIDNAVVPTDPEAEKLLVKTEFGLAKQISEVCDTHREASVTNKQPVGRRLPMAILPLLRCQLYESSESSPSLQGSPSEDRNFRSDIDEAEMEEASSSGQEYSSNNNILEWAKANGHGTLQIICEFYELSCPPRGSKITFHPLEHLHPLEYHRPDKTVVHIGGPTIDMKTCNSGLGIAEVHGALMAEEEAAALSVWSVACICGSLRLENVLTMFAGALLEKPIVVVCSNLGTLSASVLAIVPLIRPYQWQSLLMPVLPDDMLDFLDAPVPYIVGVKKKTSEVQSKLTNAILVDANKNQVRTPTMPQLPQQKELYSALSPYHAKLVGESFLGRKRPAYECTDVQAEAARGFLSVLRSYSESLCSNLRSHTITNVQSNDDKVSLLLKESFIESFPNRDRPFMKLFVDTQLFSVHTDLVLSFFQKE